MNKELEEIANGELEQVIDKVPAEFRPMMERYGPVIIKATGQELALLVDMFIEGDWKRAYDVMVQNMSTDDLIAEGKRINEELTLLNKANADYLVIQKEILREVLIAGLLIAKEKL